MQKNIKKKIVDIPIEKNLNVGDIVYTKSCMCSGNEGVKPELSSVVLDVGLIKNVDPLEIYARATKYDAYNLGTPGLYGCVECCNWYNSGINVSLEEWKKFLKMSELMISANELVLHIEENRENWRLLAAVFCLSLFVY